MKKRNFLKFGMSALLGMALAFSATSCKDDDPDYSNVTPPEVVVKNSISGLVTSISGEGIGGATVTLDGTSSTTTAADGTFAFEDVTDGTHTLKAAASGKIDKEESVTVEGGGKGSVVIWNVSLSNEGITVVLDENGAGEVTVTTETVEDNEAAEIETTVTVPENAVSDKDATITVTPVYSVQEAETISRATRADGESVFLAGTSLKCSNASASLASPVTLTYDVDASVAESVTARKLVDGRWVDIPCTVEGTKVSVTADSFTSYSLFIEVVVTKTTSSETLTFNPDLFDNLYGSGDMRVGSSSYQYKVGTEITSKGTTKLTAYLIEVLARLAGAGVKTLDGSYPINVVLSVGTALTISGTQSATTYTVSALGRSVSGKKYGDITVVTRAYNRQHTGGSGSGTTN